MWKAVLLLEMPGTCQMSISKHGTCIVVQCWLPHCHVAVPLCHCANVEVSKGERWYFEVGQCTVWQEWSEVRIGGLADRAFSLVDALANQFDRKWNCGSASYWLSWMAVDDLAVFISNSSTFILVFVFFGILHLFWQIKLWRTLYIAFKHKLLGKMMLKSYFRH